MRIMGTMEDIISSNILDSNSIAVYIRYIRVGKMIIKDLVAFLLLYELGKDALAARILDMTHLDSASLYISYEENTPPS